MATTSGGSGSSDSSNNKRGRGGFRPRRPTPKSLKETSSPPPRAKSLKANSDEELDAALKFLQRAKTNHGSVHVSDLGYSHETMLRATDYLTAETGTTEDLVGERRALMDAWDPEQAKNFKAVLEETVREEADKGFQGLSWVEDELNKQGKKEPEGKPEILGPDDEGYVNHLQKAFGDWSETIVRVDRVQKVERGGTIVRYRALVIGGNLNGCAGFGVAKGATPADATNAAARMCKRNIFFVDRYLNSGLTSNLAGRQNSCKVTLLSVPPNKGLVGHPLILLIMKYFGISDCTAKSHGNRNVHNVVRATFKAIMTHESLEDIALKRGKRLLNLERAKRLNIGH